MYPFSGRRCQFSRIRVGKAVREWLGWFVMVLTSPDPWTTCVPHLVHSLRLPQPRCIHSLHLSCAKVPILQVFNKKESWYTCVEKACFYCSPAWGLQKTIVEMKCKKSLRTESYIHLGAGPSWVVIQEQGLRISYPSGSGHIMWSDSRACVQNFVFIWDGPIVRGDARTWSARFHEMHGRIKSSTFDFGLRLDEAPDPWRSFSPGSRQLL